MNNLIKALIGNLPAVVMLIVAVISFGFVALTKLPVDLLPEIDLPTLAIAIDYRGASPETVERNVARLLEGQFLTISGVKNVITRCFSGRVFFVIQFEFGTDVDSVANDIREKIDFVIALLPPEVGKPTIFKFDPSNLPVVDIGVSGIDDLVALKEILEDNVSKSLYQIDGVASVSVNGGYEKKVYLELDNSRLYSYRLSPALIVNSIVSENQDLSVGEVLESYRTISVRFLGEFRDLDDIRNVVVANRGLYNIKLGDIADVSLKPDLEDAPIVRVNGERGVVISVNKKSGASTVDVSEKVRKAIARAAESFPNLNFTIVNDQGRFIVDSINNVRNNLLNGLLLSGVIVFLLLVSVKKTITIMLAIPMGLFVTFSFMYFFNISLNVVSLAGLALGVGLLVDNNIVVIENVLRKLREGKKLLDAAFEGASELSGALLASTLTTIFVFIPLVFSGGIQAQIFRDLSLTVSIAVFSSFFVALLLVPPMLSRSWGVVEKLDEKIEKNKFISAFSTWFDYVRDKYYVKSLQKVLSIKKTVLVFTIIFVVVGIFSFVYLGKEFLPSTDSGDLSITLRLPPRTSAEVTEKYALKVSEYLSSRPEVKYFFYLINRGSQVGRIFAGSGARGGENTASFTIKLLPKEQRSISSEEFANELRKFLENIPGRKEVSLVGGTTTFSGGGASVEIKLYSDNLDALEKISTQIEEISKKIPEIKEIRSSFDENVLEYGITFDRNKLSFYGISSSLIANTIKTSFLGANVSSYRKEGKQYEIILRLKEDQRKKLDDILAQYIPSTTGLVPLADLVSISNVFSPRMIMRENNNRVISLSVISFGASQSKVVEKLAETIKKEVYIPPDVVIAYKGTFEELQNTFRDLVLAFLLAFVLVYTTMVVIFKSFKDPFIIIFSVPYAIFSVIIFLFIFNFSLNLVSGVGLILLLGVIVNNGIVMVDLMNKLLERGYKLRDAVLEGARLRFRPIWMTTLTTVFGSLPLALGIGASSELFQPLGFVIALGLFLGTVFTLFIIPVVFEYLNRKRFA